MAAPSSKPSSSPTSSRTNPVSRNSELNNQMRRSFSGNPFAKPSVITNPRGLNPPNTPFNSPSGFPRRQSTGRESGASWRDYEDKENGKDPNPKPGRVTSPAPSKGSKNFMSPTISAASKINPSPRKKILVEKNESALSSVSSSGPKSLLMEESELRQEMDLNQKKDDSLESDSSGLLAESTTSEEKDLVNLEPTFKISPRFCSSSTPVGPLDADPSMPPYDPKANYLSPRPQFLHYKPNPRIELYQGREGEQVEANLSDTDVTEGTRSDDSQGELEDGPSSEMEKEVEEELFVPVPASTVTDMASERVEAKRMSKSCFFSGSKFIALLLVLALAFYSISGTDFSAFRPPLEGFSSHDFRVPDGVAQFAKAKFDGLAQKILQWSSDTLNYISKKISSVREMHNLVPLQYANLSGLFDNMDHGHLMFERKVLEPIREIEIEAKQVDENDQWEPEADESIEEAIEIEQEAHQEAEDYENLEFFSEDHDTDSEQHEEIEAQIVKVEHVENSDALLEDHFTVSDQLHERVKTETIKVNPVEMEQIKERIEISAYQIDIEAAIQLLDFRQEEPVSEENTDGADIACKEPEFKSEDTELEASVDNARSSQAADGKFSTKDVPVTLGILCLCATAAVAATIILAKKKGSSASNASSTTAAGQLSAKKFNTTPISATAEHHTFQERPSSSNWQTEVVDLVSQSGPSETSSFQKSSKELEGCDEAQSSERRPRNKTYGRESLASSDCSIGGGSPSYSYGSFTTYEKIPSKHGGDEEIVTPVRRSSRIRKQVTSSAS